MSLVSLYFPGSRRLGKDEMLRMLSLGMMCLGGCSVQSVSMVALTYVTVILLWDVGARMKCEEVGDIFWECCALEGRERCPVEKLLLTGRWRGE